MRKISDNEAEIVGCSFDDVLDDFERITEPDRASKTVAVAVENGAIFGLRILRAPRGSLLRRVGFRNGDCVDQLNGRPLTNAQQAFDAFSSLRSTDLVRLRIRRGGRYLTYLLRFVG